MAHGPRRMAPEMGKNHRSMPNMMMPNTMMPFGVLAMHAFWPCMPMS
jgi:hypothetical protein